MKILSILIPLLLSFNLIADEEVCLEASETDQFVEDNIKVAENMLSCAGKKPVVKIDVMKNRIELMFKRSEDERQNINRGYDSNYKSSHILQLFNIDRVQIQIAKQENDTYVPQHLLDWFSNDSKAKGFTKDDLKASITKNYLEFAQKFDCTPEIHHRDTTMSFPANFETDKLETLQEAIRAPGYTAKRDEYFAEVNRKALDRGLYCETGYINTAPYYYIAEEYPPCTGNLKGHFKDNAYDFSTLDKNGSSAAPAALKECMKDRISRGATINHVSIEASSSALANSGKVASPNECGKYGFTCLSDRRAESTKKNFIPALFKEVGVAAFDQNLITKHTDGSNGDGTSGPCPYIKDGVRKPYFNTPAGNKELDDQQFVKVHVTFDSKTKNLNNKKKFHSAKHSCREIYYKCAPLVSTKK